MIERSFVLQKIKEFQIGEFIEAHLGGFGYSRSKMQKTPLGEKIIIYSSKPGLIVGRKGQNIKQLTENLKKNFNLENPQIEIIELENINLDVKNVASRISANLERFGTSKFKGIAHKVMEDVMRAGGRGVEIVISGKVPSQRAKTWRFSQGYLKKSGDIAIYGVKKAYTVAKLQKGIVGIQVRIMPPDIRLPDDIKYIDIDAQETIEEVTPKKKKSAKKEKPKTKAKKSKESKKEPKAEEKKAVKPKVETKKEEKSEPNKEDKKETKEEKPKE